MIPTMGTIRTELVNWLLKAQKAGHQVQFTLNMAPHSKARNAMVEHFLTTDQDYLLMIDSDTIPPEDALDHIELTVAQPKILTGITNIQREEGSRANVYINTVDVENPSKIEDLPKERFTVAGCGASFLVVHRSVFEAIPKPWFKTIEFDNGNICSEDLYFCEQARNAGFEIVCDPAIVCGHAKTVVI